ncbi:MAG: orotidine-5'-phosphate decarboxylase [Syntrophaceae bacterium]|nr:orotidine-5'-phosphate decarboxylase [Syntrophaceae bacterium]
MTPSSDARSRLIFALDMGDGIDEILQWVERLRGHVGVYKIGKEAFTHFGPEIVRRIQGLGGRVFLDLKFHDIPNTVAKAAEGAVRLGVAMFNLHALGGREMMEKTVQAAQKAARETGAPMPLVLAVTVLTSLNDRDLSELGFRQSTQALAAHLAAAACRAGMGGVVASPQDILSIREACGPDFAIVTPGIRLAGDEVERDDQKRVDTPREAIRNGADYIVVGRPIRLAKDPAGAADRIVEEIALGLADRK